MIWYHGTSSQNMEGIFKHGLKPSTGIFGTAVYFTSSEAGACLFGDIIVKAVIPDKRICWVSYEEWKRKEPEDNVWPAKVEQFPWAVIAFLYVTGEAELIVKDPSLISNIYV